MGVRTVSDQNRDAEAHSFYRRLGTAFYEGRQDHGIRGPICSPKGLIIQIAETCHTRPFVVSVVFRESQRKFG
jgi:hypothetical protein